MGLLDLLLNLLFGGNKVQCPSCGSAGAKKTSDGQIHCKNPACPYFDASLERRGTLRRPGTSVRTQGGFSPAKPITIRYRNFADHNRVFVFEESSLYRKGNHLVGRVAPTGEKIALACGRIENLGEVEARLPQRVASNQTWPTPRERQVLGYHKKHGTSSALYEKIRAKYPNW